MTASDIIVLDDFFPHPGSSFRFEEFTSLLHALPNLSVHTTGTALHHTDEERDVAQIVGDHLATYPEHRGRVEVLAPGSFPRARLYYAVFLHVIAQHVDAIEAVGAAFVFTLYPGGGFALGQPGSDAQLRRIFASPGFRHVIVTQERILDYLLRGGFCRADQATLIYGGVCPRALLESPPAKTRYGFKKSSLDLCFVANRYTPTGADKGYDLFVGAARQLVKREADIRLHVVGRYDRSIIDLEDAAPIVTFYGLRPASFFSRFYAGIDAIISPTRADVAYPGAFDGFPTGCSVEAGLNETAILCSDPLALNRHYQPGRDLTVVPTSIDGIVDVIDILIQDPDHLAALGRAARARMLALFGPAMQIEPRLHLLRRVLASLSRPQ